MAFSAHALGKTFGTRRGPVQAVAPTSFTLSDGEFVSLIGPSGCGKSTLLYMAAGLEVPTTGYVELDGRPLSGPGGERGMVFQAYTLFPWLTVKENIRFSWELDANADPLRPIAEILSDVEYADHLLEIMGLEEFADALPRELSGGMKQRAAIARALLNRPRILLMDEPFGALDAQTREEMQELLLLLSRVERATVLFVTHDIEEALYLSDRILVLSAHPGRLIREIEVPFPKDRTLEVKLEPDFLRLKRELIALLHGGRRTFDRAALLRKISPARTAPEGTSPLMSQKP